MASVQASKGSSESNTPEHMLATTPTQMDEMPPTPPEHQSTMVV